MAGFQDNVNCEMDDDSSSDEDDEEEGNLRMVSIGVQTDENGSSIILEDNDRVISPSSVAEAGGSEDVASNNDVVQVEAEVVLNSLDQALPSAPTSVTQTSSHTEGLEQDVVVAAVEEMDPDLVAAEAGPSNPSVVANTPSPSSDPPIAAGVEAIASSSQNDQPTASMEAEGSGAAAEVAVVVDDGSGSEEERTLVGDVSPSFFKDMTLAGGPEVAMEQRGDVQGEQRAFGRHEEDVLMASS